MLSRGIAFLAITLALGTSLLAESIEGTVVIKRKLTKRRVTASVSLYERGPAVELDSDTDADPLAFERSRVAVYLEGSSGSRPISSKPVPEMQQTNRRFTPDMLVIQAGSKISFPNLDPVFHNVFSLSKPKIFDLGNYSKGNTRLVTFPEPGIVYVDCHLHPNMAGAIVVAPNRWNTKADQDGRFVLKDIPPGTYTIVAWHKTAGFFRQQVHIAEGRDEHVEFLIPLDENGRKLEPQRLQTTAISRGTR